jgi:hypothetical protein
MFKWKSNFQEETRPVKIRERDCKERDKPVQRPQTKPSLT